MSDEVKLLTRIARYLTRISEFAAGLSGWLVIPMSLIGVGEVVMRYALNKPTIWAWDVNVMIAGAYVALGAGYALAHDGHDANFSKAEV